ncbi:MAG TPA: hypothetical protein VFX17_00295 [Patescibacteria group bacterium]|nr:hypothetical protein [Patescibacteria group bacterium]
MRLNNQTKLLQLYIAILQNISALLEKEVKELRQGFRNPETGNALRQLSMELLNMDARLKQLDPEHNEPHIVGIVFSLLEMYDPNTAGKKPH